MSTLQFAALVIAAVGPLLLLARLTRFPAPLALVATGAASVFLPGLPDTKVDPQLLITLFLPPIIYAAAIRVSVQLFRHTLGPGVGIGCALAIVTIPAVAVTARWLLPGLDWPSALLLGVVGALVDTRLFHEADGRPKVPRAIADALKAREIVARVIALGFLGVLLHAVAGGATTPLGAAGSFTWALMAGGAAGWALARVTRWLCGFARPAPVEIAVSIALPYAGALLAGSLGLSLSATIIAAALTVSSTEIDPETGSPRSSSEARISATTFWEEVSLFLSAVLFLLAGRAMPEALEALKDGPVWRTAGTAVLLALLVLALQFAFSYLAASLPAPAKALRDRRRETGEEVTRLAAAGVMAWACTPSILGIIVALSAPPGMKDRGLALVVAALLIIGAVLVQGLTLRTVVHVASLGDEAEERGEERLATDAAAQVADGEPDTDRGLDAVRRTLLQLREDDHIGDEVLQKTLREADLSARAAQGPAAAMPGAGPPNP